MRSKKKKYRASFVAEFRDEFKNEKTSLLTEEIETSSINDAYDQACKIVASLNKTGFLAFRVLSVERV